MRSPDYVIHATHSSQDAENIRIHGFRVQSGRAVVSTDLVFAYEFASDPAKRVWSHSRTPIRENEHGRFVILKIPSHMKVDYALKTTIRVNQEAKEIVGYVTRYRYSRRQLAIYEYGSQAPEVHISPENVVMDVVCSDELIEILGNLKSKIQKLERINSAAIADMICKIIISDGKSWLRVDRETGCNTIIHRLVDWTVESNWVNLVRSLWLDVMIAKGYILYDFDSKHVINVIPNKQYKQSLRHRLQKYKLAVDQIALKQDRNRINMYVQKHIDWLLQDLESCGESSHIDCWGLLIKTFQGIFSKQR